ncbi:NAD-dependent epimerase/dehydratase family protein [Curtobacterium sp. PhB115]|uniref:NAD-dependent epimerase/dehydratase family protein n=1 Tax=Curtobacterium sp. PhB115 TaxID=2485173 RepID=UPI000F4B19F5|nr:NAD-dependent epimerase/dehydratase family protein [Curtobacterium sp. PhB115]ROP74237.1 nucleoside-diphosphate-sugar epimerase [Curtobacterium sp. PhB115]
MHVFLTGASGYIGSSVLRALLAHGHEVTAIVRSDQKAQAVRDAGGQAFVEDVTDTEVVERLLHESDGAVHTASAPEVDPDFVATVIRAYSGTPKPFVHTGGIFTFGNSTDISEQSPIDPPELTSWRTPNEATLRASDVRTTIVAPGIVYGRGAGIPSMFVGDGEQPVPLVGDGSQRWTTVHVDDLGALYALALHRGEQEGYVVAATGDNPTVREVAEAGAHGSPVVAESVDASRERLGAAYADALLLHQEASGAHARSAFGWDPTRPTLVEDLASGSYVR